MSEASSVDKPVIPSRLLVTLLSDAALRCRAFGHAFVHPDDWTGWDVVLTPETGSAKLSTQCLCENGCGTRQIVTLVARVSARGNLVEILRRTARCVYSDRTYSTAVKAAKSQDVKPPTRNDYRHELLCRQIKLALAKSKVKMRRSSASITHLRREAS